MIYGFPFKEGNIEMLFATPVYFSKVSNFDAIQNEIKQCCLFVEDNTQSKEWGKTVNVTSLSDDIISSQNMLNLDAEFDRHIKMYCDFLNFKPTKYSRKSWLAKNCKGSHTHVHSHMYYDIAGVYYFQTNENDGNLFVMPDSPVEHNVCYQNFANRKDYVPQVGKLILFPGWMLHGVKTNETDSERISLAFSIAFER